MLHAPVKSTQPGQHVPAAHRPLPPPQLAPAIPATHAPPVHVWHSVQAVHALPFVPHAVGALPGVHMAPAPLTQPLQHEPPKQRPPVHALPSVAVMQ